MGGRVAEYVGRASAAGDRVFMQRRPPEGEAAATEGTAEATAKARCGATVANAGKNAGRMPRLEGGKAHGDRRDALGASMVGLSGVGGDVGCGGSHAGAYCEPEGVATEASPEGASFGGGDGGVAFAG